MSHKVEKFKCFLKVKQPLQTIIGIVLFNSGINKVSVIVASQILYKQKIGKL